MEMTSQATPGRKQIEFEVGANCVFKERLRNHRPWVPISSPLTQMVYLLPFTSYLAGSKSASARPPARPPVRPGYDDKYCPKNYRIVERQDWWEQDHVSMMS